MPPHAASKVVKTATLGETFELLKSGRHHLVVVVEGDAEGGGGGGGGGGGDGADDDTKSVKSDVRDSHQ